jgi:hypothetical protein
LNYNIPKISLKELYLNNSNTIEKIANGTTEYVNEANRLLVDLWNSKELNLEQALIEYEKNPNNYRPICLPTSRFRIVKTNDKFSNTAMISNDTLRVQIYNNDIDYGQNFKNNQNKNENSIINISIIFPPKNISNVMNMNYMELMMLIFKKYFHFMQHLMVIYNYQLLV